MATITQRGKVLAMPSSPTGLWAFPLAEKMRRGRRRHPTVTRRHRHPRLATPEFGLNRAQWQSCRALPAGFPASGPNLWKLKTGDPNFWTAGKSFPAHSAGVFTRPRDWLGGGFGITSLTNQLTILSAYRMQTTAPAMCQRTLKTARKKARLSSE